MYQYSLTFEIDFFNTDTDARGWWFSRSEDNYYNPLDYTDSSKGFEDSLQCIIQTFKEQV